MDRGRLHIVACPGGRKLHANDCTIGWEAPQNFAKRQVNRKSNLGVQLLHFPAAANIRHALVPQGRGGGYGKMRTGTHRARGAWFTTGTAIGLGTLAGTAAGIILRTTPLRLWTVTVELPAGDQRIIPATEAFATLIAATVATTVLLAWLAARTASRHRQQKRWAEQGGAVIHGDAPARPTRDDSDTIIRLAWVEHGVRTNERDIEQIREHMRDVSGLIAGAYEDAGRPVPELAPLEDPATVWVPRVIEGGLDEAG